MRLKDVRDLEVSMDVETDQQRDACAAMMILSAGHFLRAIADAWARADPENRKLMRGLIDELIQKYPKYEEEARRDEGWKCVFE